MSEKIEYIQHVVALPKPVLEFLEANKNNLPYNDVEAYLNLGALKMLLMDMDSGMFSNQLKSLVEAELDAKEKAEPTEKRETFLDKTSMPEKTTQTQAMVTALEAARCEVKESTTIEAAVKKIDEMLLVIKMSEKVEKAEPDVQAKSERWKISIQPEQISLTLPKAVLGFYRFYARIHNSTPEDELTLDILRKLRQDFVEIDFEELFGLDRVFEKYGIQEVQT